MLKIATRLLVGFLSMLMLSVTVGATAASATTYYAGTHAVGLTFKGGPGHWSSVWAGTHNNGKRGFCIDFGLATPNRAGTTVLSNLIVVPGMSLEESKQAKFIANKFSATTSTQLAANASFAIWQLQHDAAFNTWYSWARSTGIVTLARHTAITAIRLDAQQHGPYKMTVSSTKVQVGQKASGPVKVLGSNGKPAVGRTVTLTATSAKILTVNGVVGSKGTTRSTGVVFTNQRTNVGKVSFKSLLTSPSSATAGISISSAGHQRTLSGGYTESAVAYFSYDLTAGKPTVTSVCDTDCDGQSTVTFKYSNVSGAQAIKWTEKVGTTVVATLNVAAGTTGSKAVRLTDGNVITTSYCYTGTVLGGSCTTATVNVAGSFEVVCPAWAQGEIKLPCSCDRTKPSSVTLTAPAGSPRFYRGFVSINNGAVTYQADLVNGQVVTIPIGTLGVGANVVVSFTVYRDAGHTVVLGSHVLRNITVNL